ncbi:MAG: NAD(P)/FAD-dependent oxidoreductase [Chloroflexota bacterium]|nr:NAD(P)/FAD-dependent oxidoreductase [Chloroflexota bacterium]
MPNIQQAGWIRTSALASGSAAILLGVLTGLFSSTPLADLFPGILIYLAAVLLSGAGYGVLLRAEYRQVRRLPGIPIGLVYGLVNWLIFGIVIIPTFAGQSPQWSSEQAAAQFSLLTFCLTHGMLLTAVLHILCARGWLARAPGVTPPVSANAIRHIVILGGGFAGVTTAQQLEQHIQHDPSVQITLVSKTNHLLFTPMLAEVTAGSVEAQHISPPLRAFFRHVRVVRGEPTLLDGQANTVTIKLLNGTTSTLSFDHLVLALGATPNFFNNRNLEGHAFTFKSLVDAIHIRHQVIDCLERADSETDTARRRTLLTFVVVGAGFAGVELIGGLNDFVRGSLWYYKQIRSEDVTLLLLHPRDRILPELSETLAHYAEERMTSRGVTIRGGAVVTDAGNGRVSVGDEVISTDTLIWTAGNIPNPIMKNMGLVTDKRGAVITDALLRLEGQSNIWALGDCAAVPDIVTGKNAPPTAQYALRQAKTLAHNLHAVLHDREPKAFRHHSQGALAVVGHQTACAEVFGFRFSGLFAWLLWRGIYLSKLPTLEKKTRVLLDWIVDVFFPRDITYAPLYDENPEAAASGD